MQKNIVFLLVLFFISNCTSPSSSESKMEGFNISDADKKELEAAEKKMFDEIIQFGDYWKTNVADDYITINADGVMQDKTDVLAASDSSKRKQFAAVTDTKLSERKVRKYGDIAIITGRADFNAQDVILASVYYTEIWLKKDGRWLFNGWQGTLTKEMQQAMMNNMPEPK